MRYNLSLEDLSLCKSKKSDADQLAFAARLIHFRKHIQFPTSVDQISTQLIFCIGEILEMCAEHGVEAEG
jgi:hypothetical protein